MPHIFNDPVNYYLVRGHRLGSLEADFKRITDYLLTFVGEVGLTKENEGSVIVSYVDTDLKARLNTTLNSKAQDSVISQQITLTCEKADNVSVNLLKNVTKTIGYRIFNPQTKSFLVIDPNLLDLTTVKVNAKLQKIFTAYKLTPLFQFQNAMVFYAKDTKGRIHLVNRHLLEFFLEDPELISSENNFSVVVAPDIGRFVALFDRGLIPISYYEFINRQEKVINQSGFDLEKLKQDIILDPIFFQLNLEKQSFDQIGTPSLNQHIEVTEGRSALIALSRVLKKQKRRYLSLKFAQDIGFKKIGKNLIPKIKLSIYLDS